MDCFIVGAGDFFGFPVKPAAGDCVIAADGGYLACREAGIAPDYILGDFDSLGHVPDGPNVIRVPVEKDDTDMMLAVKKGLSLKCRKFHLLGGTGGRLDHTIANIQTLLYLKKHGCTGYLYGKNSIFTVISDENIVLPARKSGILSVFSLSAPSSGVTVSGAKYALKDGVLRDDFPLGVSNHFVGREVSVSVARGTLLLCISDEE